MAELTMLAMLGIAAVIAICVGAIAHFGCCALAGAASATSKAAVANSLFIGWLPSEIKRPPGRCRPLSLRLAQYRLREARLAFPKPAQAPPKLSSPLSLPLASPAPGTARRLLDTLRWCALPPRDNSRRPGTIRSAKYVAISAVCAALTCSAKIRKWAER